MARIVERLLPAPLHRALLPSAHRLRHFWRRWRGTPLAGCAVVIENDAGEILLLRHSYGPAVWMLPGGGIGAGEEPETAAHREIAEELELALPRLQPVAAVAEVISGSPHTAHVFAAIADAEPRPDGREVVEARFFPADALPEALGRLDAGRIAVWRAWRDSRREAR